MGDGIPLSVHRYSYPDAKAAAEGCAHHALGVLENALAAKERVTFAVSGGSTSKLFFEALVAARFNWDRVHLLWADERAVSPAHPRSNYGLAEEHLILPARILRSRTHRIFGEFEPRRAAVNYTEEIRELFDLEPGEMPHIDLLHLGMGPDGHTASLFPGDPLIADREGIAAAVCLEKDREWRVTLLPGVLLAAKHTVILAAGAEKAPVLHAVFEEDYQPEKYPVQIIAHNGRSVTWFLDEAALSQTG
ncbi:MAG: 6-phosphogluconolactonase [Bryobacterales bacterium]|nr:6-phosphogluconolactonase [Bryobacterales bacterium]